MDELLNAAHDAPFAPMLEFDANAARQAQNKLLCEVGTVQWLVTWWRTLHGKVQVGVQTPELSLDTFKLLSDTLAGVTLGMLPEGVIEHAPKQVLAKFRDAFLRRQADWPDLDVQAKAVLLCLDSMPKDIGLPHQLYSDIKTRKIANWDQFNVVTDTLIAAVTQESNVRGAIVNVRPRLTTILYELFKNTHDHARQTIIKTPLDFSLRGLYARFYSPEDLQRALPHSRSTKITDEELALNQVEQYAMHFLHGPREWLSANKEKPPSKFFGLLELSIFDAGPGFAATKLKADYETSSVQQQFEAVLECFRTGKSSTGEEDRGYGLWKVLRDLKTVKGLIRVRTNRVNIYRDFARFEHMWLKHDDVGAPEERLLDWKRGVTSRVADTYPDVQGALVSVVIPLGEAL